MPMLTFRYLLALFLLLYRYLSPLHSLLWIQNYERASLDFSNSKRRKILFRWLLWSAVEGICLSWVFVPVDWLLCSWGHPSVCLSVLDLLAFGSLYGLEGRCLSLFLSFLYPGICPCWVSFGTRFAGVCLCSLSIPCISLSFCLSFLLPRICKERKICRWTLAFPRVVWARAGRLPRSQDRTPLL